MEMTELGMKCAEKLEPISKKESQLIISSLKARNIHDIKGVVRKRCAYLNFAVSAAVTAAVVLLLLLLMLL